VKAIAAYGALSALLIAVAGGALALAYAEPAARHSIVVSAWVAFVVQLFAFAVLRLVARQHVIAGWGLGALLRLVTLTVYALVVVKTFGLVATAALVSLAAFLFLSMLVEPLALKL
jgi:hypothetical protein